METLNRDEVITIYQKLIDEFASSKDPISPAGVRSENLLESALSRQFSSLGGVMKYPTVHENAATLLYGLCCNHPFHNGNKRTAFVAMLVHLDKNKYTLFNVSFQELVQMVTSVADHSFGSKRSGKRRSAQEHKRNPDEEVNAVARWIKERMDWIERGERQITYRELRSILGRFGYRLENPKDNSIDVVKDEQVSLRKFFRKEIVTRPKRIGSIGYPGDTRFVLVNELKKARKICKLTAEDGIDSSTFYDQSAMIDAFINRYRNILRTLANR